MAKTFGERLREKLTEVGMTAAELSRRSNVTKQNISRILNNTPHSITGALPKVEPETVKKLAEPLLWDINEALDAAGYASSHSGIQFSLAPDVRIALLDKNLTEDEQAEIVQELGFALEILMARKKARTGRPMTADADMEQFINRDSKRKTG